MMPLRSVKTFRNCAHVVFFFGCSIAFVIVPRLDDEVGGSGNIAVSIFRFFDLQVDEELVARVRIHLCFAVVGRELDIAFEIKTIADIQRRAAVLDVALEGCARIHREIVLAAVLRLRGAVFIRLHHREIAHGARRRSLFCSRCRLGRGPICPFTRTPRADVQRGPRAHTFEILGMRPVGKRSRRQKRRSRRTECCQKILHLFLPPECPYFKFLYSIIAHLRFPRKGEISNFSFFR